MKMAVFFVVVVFTLHVSTLLGSFIYKVNNSMGHSS
jgi:hypothetical protein